MASDNAADRNDTKLGENIGYGEPRHADDQHMIEQSARLGGAAEFIKSLPHKFDTFINRPVTDESSVSPSRSSAFAGKEFDFAKLKLNEFNHDLSGGQKQRLAL